MRWERDKHSGLLLRYWKNKVGIYQAAVLEGRILPGSTLVRGNERLTISQFTDDDVIWTVERQTATDKSEVKITTALSGRIDRVLVPTIESEIKSDPDESYDIRYEVAFEANRYEPNSLFQISRIKRVIYLQDPDQIYPSTKEVREFWFPVDVFSSLQPQAGLPAVV